MKSYGMKDMEFRKEKRMILAIFILISLILLWTGDTLRYGNLDELSEILFMVGAGGFTLGIFYGLF